MSSLVVHASSSTSSARSHSIHDTIMGATAAVHDADNTNNSSSSTTTSTRLKRKRLRRTAIAATTNDNDDHNNNNNRGTNSKNTVITSDADHADKSVNSEQDSSSHSSTTTKTSKKGRKSVPGVRRCCIFLTNKKRTCGKTPATVRWNPSAEWVQRATLGDEFYDVPVDELWVCRSCYITRQRRSESSSAPSSSSSKKVKTKTRSSRAKVSSNNSNNSSSSPTSDGTHGDDNKDIDKTSYPTPTELTKVNFETKLDTTTTATSAITTNSTSNNSVCRNCSETRSGSGSNDSTQQLLATIEELRQELARRDATIEQQRQQLRQTVQNYEDKIACLQKELSETRRRRMSDSIIPMLLLAECSDKELTRQDHQ